jgi:hypothetical protein
MMWGGVGSNTLHSPPLVRLLDENFTPLVSFAVSDCPHHVPPLLRSQRGTTILDGGVGSKPQSFRCVPRLRPNVGCDGTVSFPKHSLMFPRGVISDFCLGWLVADHPSARVGVVFSSFGRDSGVRRGQQFESSVVPYVVRETLFARLWVNTPSYCVLINDYSKVELFFTTENRQHMVDHESLLLKKNKLEKNSS